MQQNKNNLLLQPEYTQNNRRNLEFGNCTLKLVLKCCEYISKSILFQKC